MSTPTVREIVEFYIEIGDNGDITEEEYTMLETLTSDYLDEIDNYLKSDIPDSVKNHIHALALLHTAELKQIGSFKSEKIDGYSYTTKEGSSTKYSEELDRLLKRWSKRPTYSYTYAFVRDGKVFMEEDDLVEEDD